MDLPTYTNIWRIEKRLYKLYDFRLPMPLPVGTFGVALGVFALWVVLLSLVNAPFVFGNGWHLVLWVVPPGVITVLATRPVIEGKRLTELLLSQARYLAEARVYTRLAPEYEPGEVRVAVRVWHRHPEAGPLPVAVRRRSRAEGAEEGAAAAEPVEEAGVRVSGADAPPLRGVGAAPGREPASVERAPAEPEPAPAEPESAPARALHAPAERVSASTEHAPVAIATRPEPEERGTAEPLEEEHTAARASADGPGPSDDSSRGVGRRVLNYFGFALEPAEPGPTGEADPAHAGERRPSGGPEADHSEEGFDEEPVYRTEGEEQRDNDAWVARLRSSSGETPVGLTSKGAYSVGDTTALSREEVADAVTERPAARRLRGRTQGIRVARDLEERRAERARERGPGEARAARGRAQGLPGTDETPERPRRRGRPHAAPWELGDRGAEKAAPAADLSDYAARYAAATGRPAAETADAPWLPPAASAPEREREQGAAAEAPAEEPAAEAPAEEPVAESVAETPVEETVSQSLAEEPVAEAPRGTVEEAEPTESARPAPAKPALEIDHGTGEQDAMVLRPSEEAEDRGPEWNEHMSVLDRHLITADTPAPPRPAFADAVPSRGEDGDEEAARWFEDGKERHPDQPKVGDRGNPVIPASELREEAADDEEEASGSAPAERPSGADESKPATQLDHGTGELVSFVEVQRDAGRAEASDRAEAAPVRRRTVSELEEAEAAALARRRAAVRRDTPARKPGPADARGHASSEAAASAEAGTEPARQARADSGTADAPAPERAAPEQTVPEQAAPRRGEGEDPHDGVFHRVAQNARRLGQLFGQPVPGEGPEPTGGDTKPGLELDHGTGEQARLGDTPNGVPAHRPEEGGDSGGTRGWRRLARVVTGGTSPVRSDLPASDIERLRTPLERPRSLVVLGCTGGAGQTVTALMIGHTLAAHRDDRVVAVDVNPGPNGLSRRVGAQTPETLTGLLANAEAISDYSRMSGYTNRTPTGLEVVQTLDDPYVQTLDDRDYGQLGKLLGGFYALTLLDPAATGVARALPVADGLVLVAPANADAERAVSMTFDWLDGNGHGSLRARSVLVVNGVSKRSLPDVDAAERVARGRCRAIVRIPWDDHLGSSYTKIDVGSLRPATKRAHGALGGVLVNSLTQ